eukprot:Skav232568  [mRNA]  locus=scaffold1594:84650:85447:+ [translate_table: standard]
MGEPDAQVRRSPQALLSIPMALTRPQTVKLAAQQAIPAELMALARRLADGTELRSELLRSTLGSLGCDLFSLEHHCCLAALHFPYTAQEVAAAEGDEKFLRQICNQVDLCSTCYGPAVDLNEVAMLLERQCNLTLAPKLLTPEVQLAMRRKLGVGIPLQCKDVFGATVHVLLCSEDVHVYNEGPRLVFASDAPLLRQPAVQREGWFCFSSRTTGQLYYWNEITNVSTHEAPWGKSLPENWHCEVDSTTGRLHFHHPVQGQSTRLP